MKKRKLLISLLCLSAMLGVSATALTSCKPKTDNPVTPEVEYWKVTIDYNDGTTPKTTKDVVKGEKLTGVAEPTREGYEFAGWKVNGKTWTMDTAITADITIVAQWTPKSETPTKEYWTVTIDLNDGTTPTTKQVEKGQKLTGVAKPTREGFEFAGWKVNDEAWTMDEAITANITIVAQWTPKSVDPTKEYWTVTIDLNDGTTPTTKQVEKGQKLTGVAEPTREGFEFAGWKVNDEAWTMDTAITANITIVAQWTPKSVDPTKEYWTVTIDLNDGTTPTTKQVEKGQKLTGVAEPTREGFEFAGWKVNDEAWTMDTAITADITIIAQWEEITYSIIFDMHGHGTEPAEITGVKALPLELPIVEAVTGWSFEGWYLDAEYKTPAVSGASISSDVTLHAKWISQTPYEAFVAKGNIIYASDFTNDEEVILNSKDVRDYDEAYGKWVGTINDFDDFDDTNDVFVQNGYLNIVDDSSKTTYAQLMLAPIYSSVIEVKAVIQPSTVAGSWSIFTLMSPFSSSEYLLNLRTNSAKEICCQTRVYNATKDEYGDSTLPNSGGFVYVENKDLVIEATVDLNTGEIVVTLSQEGKESKTFNATINTEGYMKAGVPLAFSGVKLMTAGTASRSIKIDWLGARVVSENPGALKALALAKLEAIYEDYDKSKYTQQLELLEKTYADSVAAIQACNTIAEIMEVLSELDEAFSKIKSDEELEALGMVEEALQQLEQIKEEYKDFYTITRDSEEDYFSNKEAFDELFENAQRNLENPYSIEQIQNELANVRNAFTENGWLQNDETILESFRQHLVDEVRAYANNNGYSFNYDQVNEDIIIPLEADLVDIDTKAEMRALYTEYMSLFELIENDEQVLTKERQDACTELEEFAELALEDLDETSEIDAELIVLIIQVKDAAILAIHNATELYGDNGVIGIKDAAILEIENLNALAGSDISDIILNAQLELESYVDEKKNYYQPEEEEILNALDQVFTDHEADFEELTTASAVRDKLKELKGIVDAIVAADQLNKDKVWVIADFNNLAENYKQNIMSMALQEEFDALKDGWVTQLNNATTNEELMELSRQGNEALDHFLNEMWNRSFKVTFTNAVGCTYVNYGQNLVVDNIHITGMIVTGVLYNDEEANDLIVYDNLQVTLVMETVAVDMDSVSWSAEDNTGETSGVFVENEFFTLSEETTFIWLDASFPSGYSTGWQSGNFGGNGPDVPILLQIKENLSSLKLHIGLADSKWSSNRSGKISFTKNGQVIKSLEVNNSKLFEEVILENLECGDIIEIIAYDLNTGSRIYIFDAEAHLDYNAVPKTVAIIWGDDEEPTLYSHIEAVRAPEHNPVGEGAFQYWYYLDENEQIVIFDKTIDNYFESTTEPIHMLPYFTPANVFITYINGDETEEIPYTLGENESGIEKRILVGSPTEKFIGWFEEGSNEEFDYSSVTMDNTYTLYAKWHDLGTKVTYESKVYEYTTITALPETDSNDTMIEYFFSGETLENGVGIKTSNESKDSRCIKINLPSAGKIIVVFDNTTTNDRVGFIDTSANKTNTSSSYGYVSIGKLKDGSVHHVTLTSSDLEAGTYYVNWTGKGIIIESITIVYGVESEVEYTGISGTPVTTYTSGSELSVDLTGLTLNTAEGDAITLETVRTDLTIDIENEADFQAGLAGTYTVSITYAKYTKLVYTVTVE